ncbi:MAG: metabolite traffic protein EboE [Planctomycetota bacterium]
MLFAHPGTERRVRVGYCLNLHAAESVADVRRAIDEFSVPLRERVGAPEGSPFGVGMYFAAGAAAELAGDSVALEDLRSFLAARGIDPFTFNAFPYGGFQEDGLKEGVYRPTWMEEARVAYTVNVARAAAALAGDDRRFVSVSTHPGAYGADVRDRSVLRLCGENFGRAVGALASIEEESGVRIVLSLEAEPDASARNSRALAEFLVFARLVASRVLQDEFGRSVDESGALAARHLGTCLDCCHSAVEFEDPAEALGYATHEGPLGKLQYSSALRVPAPRDNASGRERLLALDEPRFLHQVTARTAGSFLHLPDLSALAAELAGAETPWLDADEWRCHFHVPVDRDEVGELATTRDHAHALLAGLLGAPEAWTTPELHVEIETYTWSILDEPGSVVDGLEREYRALFAQLEASGWVPAGS